MTSERLLALSLALQASGVRGQVQIGVSPNPRSALPASPEQAPQTPDALLAPFRHGGGLQEIAGALSCGRTAVAYRVAREVSEGGGWIGWIDPGNALDPRFAQRAGIALERLLWVRPTDLRGALRAAEIVVKTGFNLVVLDLVQSERRALSRLGSAAWLRLQRAARRARASIVVLGTGSPVVGAFASGRLEVERESSRFDRGLFEGYALRAGWARDRTQVAPQPQQLQVLVRS